MSKIVIIHDVEDVDGWLAYKAERAEAIKGLGGGNVVDHVAVDGGKTIAITAEADDVDELLAQVASPSAELQEAMQRHGVIPPLKVFVQR